VAARSLIFNLLNYSKIRESISSKLVGLSIPTAKCGILDRNDQMFRTSADDLGSVPKFAVNSQKPCISILTIFGSYRLGFDWLSEHRLLPGPFRASRRICIFMGTILHHSFIIQGAQSNLYMIDY
jgi:hypothetical protein